MKRILILLGNLIFSLQLCAQVPGDTIMVSTFNYSQTQHSRDTFVQFPNLPGVSYEKIYMLYNMRCKNGLVSPGIAGQTNIGCGEWDYTCNTYVVDSTKTDSVKAKHPSHIITGFNGQTFPFRIQPSYTLFKYTQQNVVYTGTGNETTATVGSGNNTSNFPFNTQIRSSKSQFLWTAAELSAAGLTAGNITGLRFHITNAASSARFLKVRIKGVNQSFLNANTPDTAGFTEVYFLNTAFTNGINSLNFYNNFNWNGSDNLLVEFSFHKSGSGSDNILQSDLTPTITGLVTENNDYNFEFTGANQIHLGNGNFNTINNQISICFWSFGDVSALPANTSVLYATNAQNHRQANIHLPWSNSSIYWDCGSGGPYDRIDKGATASEIKGQWNHWAFTKNATSGIMNIYLNGNLWHTGSAKTIPIEITNFMLGGAPNLSNPFFGKIDEFSLWNTELSAADIQNWMKKTISPSHPAYANLVAYYPFNEGTGNTSGDLSPANAIANINGIANWRGYRGMDLFKNFTETNNRPTITFVQGIYSQTITPILVIDSVINNTHLVYQFISTNGNIVPFDTNNYYRAGYSFVYDGNTLTKVDSVFFPAAGTINITQLNYYQKSPSAFQLVSFVTPYGINLDLGMQGKTWYFDVTDFAPVLKGGKRMFINGGGERQEDMDIKFMFIVGTPPRDVKDIHNLWRVDNAGFQSILNEDRFEPRILYPDPASSSYKIKTAITGHGQEGEFIPRLHWVNIAGGPAEFAWDVWKACGENPVYPQGGTWIYDRAGWCPGMATDVREFDLTPYVTPGVSNTVDYGMFYATGNSNYWVSNQLVNYGSPNFVLDAAIVDVKNPSNKIEYARSNPICQNPIVIIRNTGSTPLTSLTIEYWVNNNSTKESFQWTGNLPFLQSEEVSLPFSGNLWAAVNGATNNIFHTEIKNPNNGTDGYLHNNKFRSTFDITNVVPKDFYIRYKSNNAAAETSYEIRDENGVQVFSRSNMANNTFYNDTLHLPWGCYSLIVNDTDEDGIDFWANNDGIGTLSFRKLSAQTIKNFEGDFGKSLVYNFTVDYPLSYEELFETNDISIYPNPAGKHFILEAKNIENYDIKIYNQIAQLVEVPMQSDAGKIRVNSSQLSRGMYFVVIRNKEGKSHTQKVMVE